MRVLKIVAVLSIGLVLTLALTSQIAAAQVTEPPTTTAESAPPKPLVPFTYAWVITSNVPVYSNPGDAVPVRSLGTGFLYVSVSGQPIVQGDQTWYMINPGEYINASNIRFVRPSSFQGIPLDGTPDKPFGWMVYSVKPSPSAGAAPAKDAKIINRYTTITVYDTQKAGDLTWYRIGDNQWVDQKKVGLVFPAARPADVGPTDKWIDVNRFEQTLAAYEGDRMVYATLVSSGLPQWDTDLGLFHVYMKIKVAKMSGRDGKPDYYFLEDVPWAMYFNKDMALHGAYWHDKFGFKHSHGCVNLPLADAKWLWDWTAPYVGDSAFVVAPKDQPGTWVWVHD